jgi:phosphoribosylformylglycinamidine synthase
MLVGADTGRDGIHGASGLASRSFEDDRELRPTVQVGNPFLEKVLIEACLEAAQNEHVVGIQDLGAAGLTSASIEAAANSNSGLVIDVAKIPRRETGMAPYEVMLSESQERMLIVVRAGHEAEVASIFDRWDLRSDVIGHVTDDGNARIIDDTQLAANVPVALLTDPPLYRLDGVKPGWLDELQSFDLSSILVPSDSPETILKALLAAPNIASKEWVYRQYDHQVQTNTVAAPGGDAAVLRVKGTEKGLALTTDGNSRICYLDPYIGGMIIVAEACRNLACVGAEPIALTDCLNFGNPEKPEIYYQLENCIRGLADASQAFDAPVISGNVSLYNESHGTGIYPTPVIGALGLMDDVSKRTGVAFQHPDDVVVLLGQNMIDANPRQLAGSEYLERIHGKVVGMPEIDLSLEVRVQQVCRRLIRGGVVNSAHDCSDGGLLVALAESCIAGEIGMSLNAEIPHRWDIALFGEKQSRIVVSVPPNRMDQLSSLCAEENVDWREIGAVGGDRLHVGDILDVSLADVDSAWKKGLETALRPS